MTIINIAKDFSTYPGGRYPEDGKYSGQEFRQQYLEPYLAKNESISVEFDGTRGYGSSFLEEAFGGLIRSGYDAQTVLNKIKLVTSRPNLLEEIQGYIREAGEDGHEVAGTD